MVLDPNSDLWRRFPRKWSGGTVTIFTPDGPVTAKLKSFELNLGPPVLKEPWSMKPIPPDPDAFRKD